jgi:hypothetical protein
MEVLVLGVLGRCRQQGWIDAANLLARLVAVPREIEKPGLNLRLHTQHPKLYHMYKLVNIFLTKLEIKGYIHGSLDEKSIKFNYHLLLS